MSQQEFYIYNKLTSRSMWCVTSQWPCLQHVNLI